VISATDIAFHSGTSCWLASLLGQNRDRANNSTELNTYEIKNFCSQIQPVIKTRSNANTEARSSPARAKAVRERKELGYQRWKEKYDYVRRQAAESVFSAAKRIAGEHVAATKTENMMQEVILKFSFYNMMIH
jgi:hypothetical protein